jgi:DNA-binding GntR family transcriptional regulator
MKPLWYAEYMYAKIIDGPAFSAERNAYEYLKGQILTGELPAGAALRQEEIADKLKISRIPVRDAIRHLAAGGFVTFETNRRVTVTMLNEADVSELFEMRAVLEGLAARHATKALTDADITRLTWLADQMNNAETMVDQWMPLHHEFHSVLCEAAGMPQLAKEIRGLEQRLQPHVRILVEVHGVAELRLSRHDSVVRAIRRRNPDIAERALRKHVLEALREIQASICFSRKKSSISVDELDGSARKSKTRERIGLSRGNGLAAGVTR